MQKIHCLIVEDEPLAAELLTDYVKQIPFLQLEKVCTDALSAMEYLHANTIDLLFLDLHLPKIRGFDFLRTLKHPPRVIVTTAYHQFALEGYELNIVDYLLKPIEFSRFLSAVNKLKTETSTLLPPVQNTERKYYLFNVDKKFVKVFADEILYIESLKEYVKIITPSKAIVTKFQIGELENYLADENFLRIHRSYLIAKNKVQTFSTIEVEIGDKKIPIGRNFKEGVLKALNK
ncbi:MAG: LytR/AlgR family response regulator transcription factor [Chitinophagales bacterium]